MEQEIYKKEFAIGKILSESWRIFKENFKLIALITLLVYMPFNILLYPIDAIVEQADDWRVFARYLRIIFILDGLIGIIATMAIAYIIKNKIDGRSVSFTQALSKSLSRWPAAIGTDLMWWFFLFGLTLLFIIPGIIYYVYWIFVSYVVILHHKSGKSALDHSKAIVKGRWWKVAGYSVVFVLLEVIVTIIFVPVYWFLLENLLISIITDTSVDVAISFFTVVFVVFFINFDSTKKKGIVG